MKKLNTEIKKVLKYFSIFAYHPTLDEIHTFLKVKIDKNELKKALKRLKYTPPQYSIPTSPRLRGASKYQISKRKLQNWRYRSYIKLLALFPQIKLIGLSGSISMMNAGENDDIDLFIITAKNRLFTGRLIALVLAQILGLRRTRDSETQFFHKNKVCLNLFFDESNLKVPKFKQTEFVGHEVLQMKPIVVKGDIYEKFLYVNWWVTLLFPNTVELISKVKNQKSKIQVKSQNYLRNFLIFNLIFNFSLLTFNFIELILKKLQLISINRHRTTEIITPSQLWFHPDDFERKIRY